MGVLAVAGMASGQTCNPPITSGPDVIVGDIIGPQNYTGTATVDAFSVGTVSCNIGTQGVLWFSGSTGHPNSPLHPVIGQGLYKLKNGRFEQLGQSWLKHAFFALSETLCCTSCQSTDGSTLGVRCADTYTAARNGTQSGMGPKWQVNASTGVFPYPPANPSFSGQIARRLQAKVADLEPSSATVLYFVSAQYVTQDDAAFMGGINRYNNESYRQASMTGSGSAWNMGLLSTTQRAQAGIRAWKANDSAVRSSDVLVPGDGLFIVASKATDLGGGQWHYEYAIENLDSDRSGGGFTIPLQPGTVLTNIGFHDVDYTDGDGIGNVNFSGTDWTATVSADHITWATQAFAENASANALRWDTLYNFRFDANAAPVTGGGSATLTLFKPGTPSDMSTGAIEIPGNPPTCPCEFNHDGALNSSDFFDYLNAFFALDPAADFDGNGSVTSDDFFGFVNCFLTPPAGC
jgi:hypothetical protein